MRICYHCAWCGEDIAVLDVAAVDEAKLGFDCLTGEERAAIIEVDMLADMMHVKSLCDRCATAGGEPPAVAQAEKHVIH